MARQHTYRLGPGIEVVRVEGGYLFHSDFVAIELAGDDQRDFVERVVAPLAEPHTFEQVAALAPEYSPESVQAQLDRLVEAGVIAVADYQGPHAAAYDQLSPGGAAQSRKQLADTSITIFGLEGHGAQLALFLGRMGVGHLRLVDPHPFTAHDLETSGVFADDAVGRTRADAVAAEVLRRQATTSAEVGTTEGDALDEAAVVRACEGADLVICCFDRGFAAAHHWVNRAALALGIPALMSEVKATRCRVGPLVMPGASACWMCYRMRTIAATTDFDRVMAIEEHHDHAKRGGLSERPLLPGVCMQAAAALAAEATRLLVQVDQPKLVDTIADYDMLSGTLAHHPVLAVPSCPACGKKKSRSVPWPLDELVADPTPPADLPALRSRLHDRHCGIVTELAPLPHDPVEPACHHVIRARVANHQFLSDHDGDKATCSGKGTSPQVARTSALGEALERYAGARWDSSEFLYTSRDQLDGPSLDPRQLVLYEADQYASLRYEPYRESSKLAWMRARSLVSDDLIWVPAISAVMDYAVHSHEEFLFPITSNGLAGGPTPIDTVLNAIYEVLERDAFMLTWLQQWPGRSYDPMHHPHRDVRALAEAYRRRGSRLHLVRLPTDHPVTVFAGIVRQGPTRDGPAAVVGLGANVDPIVAARSAALEVAQVRPSVRRRSQAEQAERVAELAADPSQVTSLEDHALMYATEKYGAQVEFLFGESAQFETTPHPVDSRAALQQIVGHFRKTQQELLYVDLSAEELRPLGLHCARAILPNYQPIWFGRGERRVAIERCRGLSQTLGLPDRIATHGELNPLPHPIA